MISKSDLLCFFFFFFKKSRVSNTCFSNEEETKSCLRDASFKSS